MVIITTNIMEKKKHNSQPLFAVIMKDSEREIRYKHC